MSRYHRQQQVPQIGLESAQLLSQARVLIVGLGGLGGPVASCLAGAGVGHLSLIDFDTVDISNLHRQTLYSEVDVGKSKVATARIKLQALNSEISIQAEDQALDPSNAEQLVRQHTVVVDASDSFFVSYLLSDVCLKHRIPLVAASVLQTSGYVGVFCGTKDQPAPSMRAIFPSPPRDAQNCSTAGVTGPSVGVIASIQAQEVLKVILNDSARLLGKLLYLDLWNYRQNVVDFRHVKEPEKFAGLEMESNFLESDVLLDVRSATEVADSPRAAKHINIPIDKLVERIPELDKSRRIMCVCKSGQRALNAAHQLMNAGFTKVVVAV